MPPLGSARILNITQPRSSNSNSFQAINGPSPQDAAPTTNSTTTTSLATPLAITTPSKASISPSSNANTSQAHSQPVSKPTIQHTHHGPVGLLGLRWQMQQAGDPSVQFVQSPPESLPFMGNGMSTPARTSTGGSEESQTSQIAGMTAERMKEWQETHAKETVMGKFVLPPDDKSEESDDLGVYEQEESESDIDDSLEMNDEIEDDGYGETAGVVRVKVMKPVISSADVTGKPWYIRKKKMDHARRQIFVNFFSSQFPHLKFDTHEISSKGYRKHRISMSGVTHRATKMLEKPIGNWSVNDVPPELVQEMVDNGEFIINLDDDPVDEESPTPKQRGIGSSVNPRDGHPQSNHTNTSERIKINTAEYRYILLEFLQTKYQNLHFDEALIMNSGYRPHHIHFNGTSELAQKLIKKSFSHWPLRDVTPTIFRQMIKDGEFMCSQTQIPWRQYKDTSQDGSTIKVTPINQNMGVRKRRPVSDKIARNPSYQHKQIMIMQWRRQIGMFIESKFPALRPLNYEDISAWGYRPQRIQLIGLTEKAKEMVKKNIANWSTVEMGSDKLESMIKNGEFYVRDLRGTPHSLQENQEESELQLPDENEMIGDDSTKHTPRRSGAQHSSVTPARSHSEMSGSAKKSDPRTTHQYQLRELLGRFIECKFPGKDIDYHHVTPSGYLALGIRFQPLTLDARHLLNKSGYWNPTDFPIERVQTILNNNEIDVTLGKVDGAVFARVRREQEKRKRREAGIESSSEDEDDEDEDEELDKDGPMYLDGNVIKGGMVLRKRRKLIEHAVEPVQKKPEVALNTPITPVQKVKRTSASLSAVAKNRPRTSNGTFLPKGMPSDLEPSPTKTPTHPTTREQKPNIRTKEKSKEAELIANEDDGATFTIDNSAPGDKWAMDMQKLLGARKEAILKKKEMAERKAKEAEEERKKAEEDDEQLAKFALMVS